MRERDSGRRAGCAACGRYDACLLRLKGFGEAGLTDPAPYQPAATD